MADASKIEWARVLWRAAGTLAIAALLASGLALGSACVIDNDSIEGKECDLDADPFKKCIQGYECQCEPDACYCRKVEELSSALGLPPAAPPSATLELAPLERTDPSARFLIRLGLEVE